MARCCYCSVEAWKSKAVLAQAGSPVEVSVAESSYRDGERLPDRIQIVLDYFSLVADGEPGNSQIISHPQLSYTNKVTSRGNVAWSNQAWLFQAWNRPGGESLSDSVCQH